MWIGLRVPNPCLAKMSESCVRMDAEPPPDGSARAFFAVWNVIVSTVLELQHHMTTLQTGLGEPYDG